jgi:hypothetical protein
MSQQEKKTAKEGFLLFVVVIVVVPIILCRKHFSFTARIHKHTLAMRENISCGMSACINTIGSECNLPVSG